MKFKTVVLCLKLLTCLIVQRSFGSILDTYIYVIMTRYYGFMCIMASENILACGKLCFRVFKLQLKVINKFFFICT